MVSERTYIATFWRTDDTRGEFYFESCHRAGSRANYEDFMRSYRRKFGESGLRFMERSTVEIYLAN